MAGKTDLKYLGQSGATDGQVATFSTVNDEWEPQDPGDGGVPSQTVISFTVESGETVTALDVVGLLGNGNVRKGRVDTTPTFGSEVVFDTSSVAVLAAAALDDTHFVVCYADGGASSAGKAVVGVVSGTTITYGSQVQFEAGNSIDISVDKLSSTSFVVTYRDVGDSNNGKAVVGTVVGDVVTVGSPTTFNAANTNEISVAALSSTKCVIGYQDTGNSSFGTAIIGSISGTTISFGSEVEFNSASTAVVTVSALDSERVVISYKDTGNSSHGTAVIGFVSDTVITFGSEFVFNAATTNYPTVAALDASSFVVAYDGASAAGTAAVGTVSGNEITFGSTAVFNTGTTAFLMSAAVLTSRSFVVSYSDQSNSSFGTEAVGTISGTDITFGDETVFNSANTQPVSLAILALDKFVTAYRDIGNSSQGTAIVGEVDSAKVNAGIAKTGGSGGASIDVVTNGKSDSHSGLTKGDVMFSDNGTLTASVSGNAILDNIGRAISTTEIYVQLNWQ